MMLSQVDPASPLLKRFYVCELVLVKNWVRDFVVT